MLHILIVVVCVVSLKKIFIHQLAVRAGFVDPCRKHEIEYAASFPGLSGRSTTVDRFRKTLAGVRRSIERSKVVMWALAFGENADENDSDDAGSGEEKEDYE